MTVSKQIQLSLALVMIGLLLVGISVAIPGFVGFFVLGALATPTTLVGVGLYFLALYSVFRNRGVF